MISFGRVVALMVFTAAAAACGGGAISDSTEPADGTATTALTETTAGGGAETTEAEVGVEPPLELAGTTWDVTHYQSDITGGFTNLWPDTEITLQFGTDGTISGNAGCNDYSATYQVEGSYITDPDPFGDEEKGQAIEIGELTMTEIACEAEDVMEQETEYLTMLQEAERWLIGEGFGGDNALILRSSGEDGRALVEANPAG